MRLKKYINEIHLPSWDEEVGPVIPKIQKNCKQILPVYKKTGMKFFRGVFGVVDNWIERKPRRNRLPMNTPGHLHDIVDSVFKKRFGWKVRSEGVFVTSDVGSADSYGFPCVFFPFDGFKFIWSPKIDDLYMEIDVFFKKWLKETDHPMKWLDVRPTNIDDIEEGVLKAFFDWLVEKYYTDTNLAYALKSGNEVMFKCKKYYAVDDKYEGYLEEKLDI